MVELIRTAGVRGINPLLEEEDALRLYSSVDPLEISELIISGLLRIS